MRNFEILRKQSELLNEIDQLAKKKSNFKDKKSKEIGKLK